MPTDQTRSNTVTMPTEISSGTTTETMSGMTSARTSANPWGGLDVANLSNEMKNCEFFLIQVLYSIIIVFQMSYSLIPDISRNLSFGLYNNDIPLE